MLSMPTTKTDFFNLADQVVELLFNDGVPLTEGVARVASTAGLNPEEVRRLVEKSNVVATVRMLKMSTDKKATLALAEYSDVLEKTHPKSTPATQTKEAYVKTAVLKETRRNAYVDLLEIFKVHGQQKTASTAPVTTDHVSVFKLQKQIEELKLKKIATETIVKDALDYLASEFSKYNAPDFQKFASEALALHGDVCIPTLSSLSSYLNCKCNLTKVAEYIIDDTTNLHVKLAEVCAGVEAIVLQDGIIEKAMQTLSTKWNAAKGLR